MKGKVILRTLTSVGDKKDIFYFHSLSPISQSGSGQNGGGFFSSSGKLTTKG